MGTKTYDVKCSELAEVFLADEQWWQRKSLEDKKRFIAQLASEIQETIESEIASFRDDLHVNM